MKLSLLQIAVDLAVAAHRGQEDPPGEPYIIHPLRVLLACSAANDSDQDERLRCVAVLHDVLERTSTTAGELRDAGMPSDVVRAVDLLTHRRSDSYTDYVVRLKQNRLARAVKIADLQDNADLRRVTFRAGKGGKDAPRVARYAASYKYLTGQISEKSYRRLMRWGE